MFSCRKRAFFPDVHKIGAAISGPRIADMNLTDTGIFLNQGRKNRPAGGGGGVCEQRRVDLATFRALPASTWDTVPKCYVFFSIVWDTPEKEKVAKWSSAPASILEGFNEIYVVYGPKKPYKTREKRQSCQIDPCLPPYGGGVYPKRVYPKNLLRLFLLPSFFKSLRLF